MAPTRQAHGHKPMERLKFEASGLVGAVAERAASTALDRVENMTGRLTEYVENGAGPGLKAAITGATNLAEGKSAARSSLGAGMAGLKEKASGLLGGGGGKVKSGRGKLKVTNIIESIDVAVPVRVAYDQWTQFTEFPTFMKKVENIEQAEDQTLNWKAQILWSHREWEANILEQQPEEKIVWQSKGQKGHVDGAVTFHELGPRLTRIIVVLEYHPQGFFEHTGNIWRAQGRRVRLELKHFARHLMANAILHPEEVEGWRGVIEEGEVTRDHETAVAEEQGEERGEWEDEDDERAAPEDFENGGLEPDDLADEGEPDESEPDESEPDEGERGPAESSTEPADAGPGDRERGGARPRRAAQPRRQPRPQASRTAARPRPAPRGAAREGERS